MEGVGDGELEEVGDDAVEEPADHTAADVATDTDTSEEGGDSDEDFLVEGAAEDGGKPAEDQGSGPADAWAQSEAYKLICEKGDDDRPGILVIA